MVLIALQILTSTNVVNDTGFWILYVSVARFFYSFLIRKYIINIDLSMVRASPRAECRAWWREEDLDRLNAALAVGTRWGAS